MDYSRANLTKSFNLQLTVQYLGACELSAKINKWLFQVEKKMKLNLANILGQGVEGISKLLSFRCFDHT